MKHEVNAMGKQCPIPVVMTKKVIDNAAVGDEIEILIDNETAVNNLSRLANKTGCTFVSEKLGDKKYQVKMAVKTEQTGGTLEEQGVEILTCGTCLKHYGLMEKLMVGKVTDMYTIAERMTGADKVIRP